MHWLAVRSWPLNMSPPSSLVPGLLNKAIFPLYKHSPLERWPSGGKQLQLNSVTRGHKSRGQCLEVGGEGDDRGWDSWMASATQWTWTRANSGMLRDRETWRAVVHGGHKKLDTTWRLNNRHLHQLKYCSPIFWGLYYLRQKFCIFFIPCRKSRTQCLGKRQADYIEENLYLC